MRENLLSLDPGDLYSVLRNSWEQITGAWKPAGIPESFSPDISRVIISGLGGSAISGDVLKNFLKDELKVPVTVNRSYDLPLYAGPDTLLIISSYSGNTEETVSALNTGIGLKCPVIAVTTGGEIGRIAMDNGFPLVTLTGGLQPRYALYSSFFTLLRLFQELKLIASQDSLVERITASIRSLGERWSMFDGDAFSFAGKLKGTVPVIYTISDVNDSAGRRFKGQLNENSKVHAWCAEYPEMNHNEIVGWETASGSGIKYVVVTMPDDEIHPRIKKRIDIINKLMVIENIDILSIKGCGSSFRERLIETIYFCDWVSYFLALLNGKDPGEIDFIHYLKNSMSEGK